MLKIVAVQMIQGLKIHVYTSRLITYTRTLINNLNFLSKGNFRSTKNGSWPMMYKTNSHLLLLRLLLLLAGRGMWIAWLTGSRRCLARHRLLAVRRRLWLAVPRSGRARLCRRRLCRCLWLLVALLRRACYTNSLTTVVI